MQEGILSLMQMPRTTVAVHRIREAGLPYVVVLSESDDGRRDRELRHAGRRAYRRAGRADRPVRPRVIENTIREKLPEGFQRAEYLLDHGMSTWWLHRHRMRETLGRLLGLCATAAPRPAPEPEPETVVAEAAPETPPPGAEPAPAERPTA